MLQEILSISDYGVSPQKVTTIRPYVRLTGINTISERPSRAKVRLLFVGNEFERKGGTDLLGVLKALGHPFELDVVSNGNVAVPEVPGIRVHRGLRPLSAELQRLYAEADIFVMPTREDCFPMVFVEAMAAGLPCIGTTVVAVPELVRNGVNGICIPPRDPGKLAAALDTLASSPELRKSMGAAGRHIARTEFDPVKNSMKMAEVFRQAAGRLKNSPSA